MTNQQLKDKIQAALEESRAGGPAGEIDEITAALSHRGPSGAHHAGPVAAYRNDPQTLSAESCARMMAGERAQLKGGRP